MLLLLINTSFKIVCYQYLICVRLMQLAVKSLLRRWRGAGGSHRMQSMWTQSCEAREAATKNKPFE